jgi:hypothetical protein
MASDDAAAARFAWCAAFFATLSLIAVLGIARSAQALTLPESGVPRAPEECLLTRALNEGQAASPG